MSQTTTPPGAAEAAAEYATLRAEIVHNDGRARDLLVYTTGAVGAILAFWFLNVASLDTKALTPARFLFATVTVTLALAATFVGGNLIASYRRSTWRISTYISAFLDEARGGPGWETRLNSVKDRAATEVSIRARLDDLRAERTRTERTLDTARRLRDEFASAVAQATPSRTASGNSSRGIKSDMYVLLFLQTICAFSIVVFLVVMLGPLLAEYGGKPLVASTSLHFVLGLALCFVHFALFFRIARWTLYVFAELERFGPIHQGYEDDWARMKQGLGAAAPPQPSADAARAPPETPPTGG